MPEPPVVSVIITTYYPDDELECAIESCLAQTYEEVEVIVVDDSGEGYAADLVRPYESVTYVKHNENRGQIAAWNSGMECTSGEYVQFHDDDDQLFEDKIETQVAYLRDNPDVGSVYCGYVDDSGNEQAPDADSESKLRARMLRQHLPSCQTTTMLTRRGVLNGVFPLPKYPAATDIVLQFELFEHATFDYVDEVLVRRTLHEGSVGASMVNRETRVELIEDYRHLYEERPEVKREALARAYFLMGNTLLDQKVWSLRPILAYVKANFHSRGQRRKFALRLGASFFGRPGLRCYSVARPYLAQIKNRL